MIVKQKCVLNHFSDARIAQITIAVALIEIDLNALSHKGMGFGARLEF